MSLSKVTTLQPWTPRPAELRNVDPIEIEARCADYFGTLLRRGGLNVEFFSSEPINPRAARHWRSAVEHVASSVADAPGGLVSQLLLDEGARYLVAVALSTFPNTTMPVDEAADRRGAAGDRSAADGDPPEAAPPTPAPASETLALALDFIEANAQEPLTVRDIATAAGVTPRALQLAFRKHLDTTPMAHLRRVRLSRVHDELRCADVGTGATVTQIASRWGLCGSSRFTEHYRRAYGVTPSETLAG